MSDFVEVGGVVYFVGFDPFGASGAVELWRTDGTAAGTFRLKDIYTSETIAIGDFPAYSLATTGDRLYFTPLDPVVGSELWVTDGTREGTRLVRDIVPGELSSGPGFTPMAAVGGRVFFGANDGVRGHELWVSDGTAAGTVMVADLFPGVG
jgi:ELWxxDGT repeat protein